MLPAPLCRRVRAVLSKSSSSAASGGGCRPVAMMDSQPARFSSGVWRMISHGIGGKDGSQHKGAPRREDEGPGEGKDRPDRD